MTSLILGIESSCDETAAAVVADGRVVRSNVVATQHDLHRDYAGIVPEIASRAHLERILPVIQRAMCEAGVSYGALDGIAVGHRPGLIGSLLVGVAAAKALAWSLGKPLIAVDHVAAHLHACVLDAPPLEYPAIGLVVSGGHTSIFRMEAPDHLEIIGKTIDDAVGEAFDKAASTLELGYPGGPLIDALAARGHDDAFHFPVPALEGESLDMSFSGLKTALLYAVRGQPRKEDDRVIFARTASELTKAEKADFAASFQRAAVANVISRLERAADAHPAKAIVAGGGVCANTRLRSELAALAEARGLVLRIPPPDYCIDNAAMIAGCACARLASGNVADLTLSAATTSLAGH